MKPPYKNLRKLSLALTLAALPVFGQAADTPATIAKGTAPDRAPFLVDAQGRTLYILGDGKEAAACDAECRKQWEPVLTQGRPLGQMILPGLLGTVDHEGKQQVTYMGKPLFRFTGDSAAGDMKGLDAGTPAFALSVLGEPEGQPEAVADAGPVQEEVMAKGRELFAQNCAACHGANGEGAFGTKLDGFARLSNASALARTVVHGMNTMPEFGSKLSDEQVAAIGTFVRNSWTNDFGAMSAEQVKAVR